MSCIAQTSRLFILALTMLLSFGLTPQNKAYAQSPIVYLTNFKFDVVYSYNPNVQDTFRLTCEIDGTASLATLATTPHLYIQYYDDSFNPMGGVYLSQFQFQEIETDYTKQQSGNVIALQAGRGDSCPAYNIALTTHDPQQNPKWVVYWYTMDVGIGDGQGHGAFYQVTSPKSKYIALR